MKKQYYIFDFFTRKRFFCHETGILLLDEGKLSFHTLTKTIQIGTPKAVTFKLTKDIFVFTQQKTSEKIELLRTGSTNYTLRQTTINKLIAQLPARDETKVEATARLIRAREGEYAESMFLDGKYNTSTFALILLESGFKEAAS